MPFASAKSIMPERTEQSSQTRKNTCPSPARPANKIPEKERLVQKCNLLRAESFIERVESVSLGKCWANTTFRVIEPSKP